MIGAMIIALLAGPVTAEARVPAGTIIDASYINGAPADVAELTGRQAVRTLYPGRTITLADTKEPDLVDRNGLVRIVARKGPLAIETKGRSLGAGTRGEEILVMNLESRRTITARIVGPGLVEVDL
ncbi:flagellar basal body P-ring formation chaperone FlgA [Parvularcula sp. LCG005]|uniref:flagellar basal body P-ring formation chaperone FlgA n=1 Tax=Parvularcula sp. LCG005 TaxID=3078805 RepID=UPI002943E67C|nr:flagellar basal body P-ring formation chaperone FlgA [Parvularcula sp. LCG005]WOI52689.1 flagellar basal body P-ring formation chaperone FlgA [Parvularcula sp. LCG005]